MNSKYIREEKSCPIRRELSFGEEDKERAEKVFPFPVSSGSPLMSASAF